MDISPRLEEGAPVISRYGAGGFVIGGDSYRGAILVSDQGVQDINITNVDEIKPETLHSLETELLIIGCGLSIQFLPVETRIYLEENHIPYDIMDTGAACRTFNILLQEGRRASALLISV